MIYKQPSIYKSFEYTPISQGFTEVYKFKPYDSIKSYFNLNSDGTIQNLFLRLNPLNKLVCITGYFATTATFINNHNTGSNPNFQPSLFYVVGNPDPGIVYRFVCCDINGGTPKMLQYAGGEIATGINVSFDAAGYDCANAIGIY